MQIHDVAQRSPQWYALRMGCKVTASDMDKIVTPTGKLSKQADEYMNKKLAEFFLKQPTDQMAKTYWMERGQDMEAEAAKLYEFTTGSETKSVGFVTTDDGNIGVSPDRFVGTKGGVEIKCPAPWTHIGYMLNPEQLKLDYYNQFQTQIWVCDREWWELYSYYPELPPVRIKMEADHQRINLIKAATDEFVVKFEEAKLKLIELGAVVKPAPIIETIPAVGEEE